MKKIILAAFVCLALASCTGRQGANEQQTDALQLQRQLAEKDSLLNDVFASLNEISSNLTEIKDREGIITANVSPEIRTETRAQIYQDIAVIDELLRQNRLSLERLQGTTEQLRRANVRVGELETLVAGFAKQIRDKDADIALLREELESVQLRVAELTTEVDSLQAGTVLLAEDRGSLAAKLDVQDDMMHTVYYIVGRERSLLDEGILDRSGGLFNNTVKLGDGYDRGQFTQTDQRSLDRIIVSQRRATIVTPHPAGSYQLSEGSNGVLQEIVITDPDRFWEMSRVLVVSYK